MIRGLVVGFSLALALSLAHPASAQASGAGLLWAWLLSACVPEETPEATETVFTATLREEGGYSTDVSFAVTTSTIAGATQEGSFTILDESSTYDDYGSFEIETETGEVFGTTMNNAGTDSEVLEFALETSEQAITGQTLNELSEDWLDWDLAGSVDEEGTLSYSGTVGGRAVEVSVEVDGDISGEIGSSGGEGSTLKMIGEVATSDGAAIIANPAMAALLTVVALHRQLQ